MKKTIRSIILALIALLGWQKAVYAVPANENFIDDSFYKCVINAYNTKNGTSLGDDTNLTDEQLATITSLSCSGNGSGKVKIESAKGIEKMPALTSVNLSTNSLTSIDLSNNPNITSLWLYNNNLTSLDVSNLTELTNFKFYNNKLKSLNVLNNVNITTFEAARNNMLSLDLSANVNINSTATRGISQSRTVKAYHYSSTGVYKVYLRDYQENIDTSKITITTPDVTMDATTGVLLYTGELESIEYNYNTGNAFADAAAMPVTLNLSVVEAASNITITKKDNNNDPISNAVIGLYNSEKELITQKTTGSDGTVVFENVEWGIYYIKDVQSAQGYTTNTEWQMIDLVSNHENAEVMSLSEQILGKITIYLKGDSTKPLNGIKFGLYDSHKTLLEEKTTNSEGKVEFADLPWGEYYVKQLTAYEGYKIVDTFYSSSINGTTYYNVKELVNYTTDTTPIGVVIEDEETDDKVPTTSENITIVAEPVPETVPDQPLEKSPQTGIKDLLGISIIGMIVFGIGYSLVNKKNLLFKLK